MSLPKQNLITADYVAGNQSFLPTAEGAYLGVFTWANRPSATTVSIGSWLIFSDIGAGGYSQWRSDGTYWRPVNGRIVLYQVAGSLNNPIATLAGNGTSQKFTLPADCLIPGGMAFPGCNLEVYQHIRRTANGGAGTVTANVWCGNVNAATGAPVINGAGLSSGVTQDWDGHCNFYFRGITEQHRLSFSQRNNQAAGYFSTDTAENAANNLYVNFGGANTLLTGDTIILVAYSVSLMG